MTELSSRPIHVVAIDDETSALAVLEAACALGGFRFTSTTDPEEGMALVREHEPDVVLLDVMMPGVNGYDLCARIKADPSTQFIPVVLVTALDSRSDRLRGLEANCDEFLAKPVRRMELTARVRSLARLRRLTEDLDDAERLLETLALAVEAKDGTTGDHCARLRSAGIGFGTYLGLPMPDVKALSRAAVLHDIGKIGIPDAVLLKPGKLDEDEWKVMRRHVTIGAELLKPLRTMRRVLPIVRHHHEKWNGSGYPDGLAGEDIPLLARVFSLLDAYDALRSERPYKRAFTEAESLDILEEECQAGKWDPTLLGKFRAYLATTR